MKLPDGTAIAPGWEQCYAACKSEVFEASCDEREAGDEKIIVHLIEELSRSQQENAAANLRVEGLEHEWNDAEERFNMMAEQRLAVQHENAALKARVEQLSGPVTEGARLIVAERQRQIEKEGWASEHDDEHDMGELASAAVCYALTAVDKEIIDIDSPHEWWPWAMGWWKPSEDIVRNLTKAGALIAAEIDRLLRIRARSERSSQ